MKIGIIGAGFVGSAIKNTYERWGVPIITHDPAKGFNSSYEELRSCDGLFVCVPSPTTETGECDTSILEDVLSKLAGMSGVIISKVTAPPSVYAKLQIIYPNLVHAPEFLVAATAEDDYRNGTFAFIGGSDDEWTRKAEEIIRAGQRNLMDVKYCSITEASLAKYTINSFLATKVAFMNQVYDLAKQLGVDYQTLVFLLGSEKRFGNSHMQVPGPDGRGFAGACFPKDTAALVYESNKAGVTMSIVETAIAYNNFIRSIDK